MLNQQPATQIDPFFGGWQVNAMDGEVRMTSRRSVIAASVAKATEAWLTRSEARSAERSIANTIRRVATTEM